MLGTASIWIRLAALVLQIVALLARNEAWHLTIEATGGSVSRRVLYRANDPVVARPMGTTVLDEPAVASCPGRQAGVGGQDASVERSPERQIGGVVRRNVATPRAHRACRSRGSRAATTASQPKAVSRRSRWLSSCSHANGHASSLSGLDRGADDAVPAAGGRFVTVAGHGPPVSTQACG